jgi:hypothetical protein
MKLLRQKISLVAVASVVMLFIQDVPGLRTAQEYGQI